MTDYKPALPLIVGDRELPGGWDEWAIKSVHADLTTRNGYRYPWPGNIAEAPGPILDHNGACPHKVGDGICVATTYAGMASGGIPARTLLLVAYRTGDALGADSGKLRVRRALVVDVLDGERITREHLSGANLSGANLYGADLSRANLSRANLYGANLYRANLSVANLHGADLHGANLHGADLSGADLHGADLSGADLSRADLYRADLSVANLYRADLYGADLCEADLGDWERGPNGYAQLVTR